MVNTKLLHQIYIELINVDINRESEKNVDSSDNYSTLLKNIIDYKDFIELSTDKTLGQVLKFTSSNQINKLEFSIDKVFLGTKTYDKEILLLYLNAYIDINKDVTKSTNRVSYLNNQKIDAPTYNKILMLFNLRVVYAIIEEGYVFDPGYAFGKLFIAKTFTEIPKVDIGSTMKRKKRLIENNQIPYNQKDFLQAQEEGKEYKGIEYLVYFNQIGYFIKWKKMGKFLVRGFLFNFIYKPPKAHPTSEKPTNFVGLLRDYIRENPVRASVMYERDDFINRLNDTNERTTSSK